MAKAKALEQMRNDFTKVGIAEFATPESRRNTQKEQEDRCTARKRKRETPPAGGLRPEEE